MLIVEGAVLIVLTQLVSVQLTANSNLSERCHHPPSGTHGWQGDGLESSLTLVRQAPGCKFTAGRTPAV